MRNKTFCSVRTTFTSSYFELSKMEAQNDCNSVRVFSPSVCEVCAKVCSSERELKIHMDDHEGKVGCVCHHCGANFKERKAYERHIARNHKPRDIGCLHCDHKFHNKDQATRHLAMHSGFKPYQCPSLAFNAFSSIFLLDR